MFGNMTARRDLRAISLSAGQGVLRDRNAMVLSKRATHLMLHFSHVLA